MSRHPSLKFSIFLLCLLLAWEAIPARAATLTVTSTADSGVGTLREAITNATNGDTINFTISGTIQLLSNLPDITANGLTINGNGATINGGTDIRVFTITGNVSVTINNLTMTGGGCNSACPRQYDFGGGIYNTGTLTISNSTLSSNSATNGGGGIYNASGTVTLTNSTLSSNSATYGSGIYNASGTMTISNSTLSGNSAFDGGGGIYNASGTVTISNSTLSGNSANGGGGGIYNDGTLTLSNSTLSSNSARTGIGGGIRNNGGTLTISNSTLSGNSTGYGGGGIYNSSGTVSISNSTLSGNSVRSGGGGGIANEGTVVLSNSTLSGNSASAFSGGIGNWGTVTLKNTLLDKGASGANCYGTFASNGAAYNLANDGSCGAGVTQVASLGLGTLGANGGPTQTIPLLTGSPAIDMALAADCPATDQRGFVRPAGAGCDIGAFEYVPVPPAVEPTPLSSPAPALCSLSGFPASAQVAIYLPNGGNGLNVCYSLISDPVQAGVTEQPFTLAADVYTFDSSGSVTTGVPVQVCLQGAGTLLYRDASGQPRTTDSLPAFSQGGFTCGLIPHAGTVILVPGTAAPTAPPATTALNACRVTVTNMLNLRAEPDATSAVIDHVPYQTTLNASARSGEWLQVVFGSQQGWLSAAYLTFEGDCG